MLARYSGCGRNVRARWAIHACRVPHSRRTAVQETSSRRLRSPRHRRWIPAVCHGEAPPTTPTRVPRASRSNPKGVVMGIKQHLVGLQEIGPDNEGAAVTKLEMRSLQLGPLAADDRPVFAPIELECFARLKDQWNERTPTRCLLCPLSFCLPA